MFARAVTKVLSEGARKITRMRIIQQGGNVLDPFAAFQPSARAAHPFGLQPGARATSPHGAKMSLQLGQRYATILRQVHHTPFCPRRALGPIVDLR
jgi:hypothetical protein